MDNDILREFLAESRELLADAQQKLLALEAEPTDAASLAAIFRAFHTLKGGAGFLEAPAMVEWCHHLEDLLDKLRSHKLVADSGMIDAILRSVDVLQRMLGELSRGEQPLVGPADLGSLVRAYANGEHRADTGSLSADESRPAAESPSTPVPEEGFPNEPHATRDATEDSASSTPMAAPAAADASGSEPGAETTIRVDSTRLDRAMNQVGELVLLCNRLSAAVAKLGSGDDTLVRLARETDLAVNDLQNTVMRLRMQPCKRLFQSLPRVVRDASRSLGKRVRL
ncbi:MAG: Hpt domain-containing protein, partial [Gammaproteobacteria bacterium]|nr:Hpt domain-containing protein [Gammaproteobacteria bacterium]